ncbi:MAG: DUF1576 domain-containing protein [Anaeroplasma sp.]
MKGNVPFMKKLGSFLYQNFFVDLLGLLLLVLSFCVSPPIDTLKGFVTILFSPSILLTDYVYISCLGAALFNASIMLFFNLMMIRLLKLKMSGPVYASLMIVFGFSFFGKNLLNTLPIYLGIFLFSVYKKTPFKNLIIAILLSTGLGPLVSYTMFGFGLQYYISIPLGILCGVASGFIIPAFTAHTLSFHEGYNIYNTGFALGIIAAMFNGLFILFGLKSNTLGYLLGYDNTNQIIFYILLYSIALFFIIISLVADRNVITNYFLLLKSSGRLISNYSKDYGTAAVLLNFAILDIVITSIFAIFGIPMNGIIFGSILSILGCSAFGLHIRNVYPVWLGCFISIAIKMVVNGDLGIIDSKLYFNLSYETYFSTFVAFIFASGIAPISGKYGLIYGLVGGFIHIVFTPLVLPFQGGFDLYNNGFSAGFEASVLVVCAEKIFNKERKHARKSKNK